MQNGMSMLMPTTPLQHLVFDWNGTLLDDATLIYDTVCTILEAHHTRFALDKGHFFARYHVPFESSLRSMGVPEDAIIDVMHQFHDAYEARAANAPLRQGAQDILRWAADHNLRCIILSNHIVDAIHPQLERHGIAAHFADVLAYASRAVQFKDMTKGERLRRYFAEHGFDPREALIIGDSAEEAEIAHAQGMTGVLITGGSLAEPELRAANPHAIIHQWPELPPLCVGRVGLRGAA